MISLCLKKSSSEMHQNLPKCGKFWSNLLHHFIKHHKPLFSEECPRSYYFTLLKNDYGCDFIMFLRSCLDFSLYLKIHKQMDVLKYFFKNLYFISKYETISELCYCPFFHWDLSLEAVWWLDRFSMTQM